MEPHDGAKRKTTEHEPSSSIHESQLFPSQSVEQQYGNIEPNYQLDSKDDASLFDQPSVSKLQKIIDHMQEALVLAEEKTRMLTEKVHLEEEKRVQVEQSNLNLLRAKQHLETRLHHIQDAHREDISFVLAHTRQIQNAFRMRGGPQVEGAIASTDMFGLPADSYLSAPENKHVVLRNTATQTVGFPLDQERSRWQLALMKLRNALAVSQMRLSDMHDEILHQRTCTINTEQELVKLKQTLCSESYHFSRLVATDPMLALRLANYLTEFAKQSSVLTTMLKTIQVIQDDSKNALVDQLFQEIQEATRMLTDLRTCCLQYMELIQQKQDDLLKQMQSPSFPMHLLRETRSATEVKDISHHQHHEDTVMQTVYLHNIALAQTNQRLREQVALLQRQVKMLLPDVSGQTTL